MRLASCLMVDHLSRSFRLFQKFNAIEEPHTHAHIYIYIYYIYVLRQTKPLHQLFSSSKMKRTRLDAITEYDSSLPEGRVFCPGNLHEPLVHYEPLDNSAGRLRGPTRRNEWLPYRDGALALKKWNLQIMRENSVKHRPWWATPPPPPHGGGGGGGGGDRRVLPALSQQESQQLLDEWQTATSHGMMVAAVVDTMSSSAMATATTATATVTAATTTILPLRLHAVHCLVCCLESLEELREDWFPWDHCGRDLFLVLQWKIRTTGRILPPAVIQLLARYVESSFSCSSSSSMVVASSSESAEGRRRREIRDFARWAPFMRPRDTTGSSGDGSSGDDVGAGAGAVSDLKQQTYHALTTLNLSVGFPCFDTDQVLRGDRLSGVHSLAPLIQHLYLVDCDLHDKHCELLAHWTALKRLDIRRWATWWRFMVVALSRTDSLHYCLLPPPRLLLLLTSL